METNQQKTNNKELTLLDRIDIIQGHGIDLDKATIFIAGDITGEFTIALRMKVAVLKAYWEQELQKPLENIFLVCNSLGGDATIILSMADYYEELLVEGIKVNIHFEGNCMSAATFICAGATGIRTAGRRCRFMIHEVQVAPPEGTFTQAKSFANETSFLQKEMLKLYAQFTQKDKTKQPTAKEIKIWADLSTKETYMSAEEAKKLGLIDEIA